MPVTADRTQVEQRIAEEAGRLPEQGAVTGWAALRLHGGGYFDGLGPDGVTELPVLLTIPPSLSPREAPGVDWHREHLDSREITTLHGLRCTTPLRATFDAVRRAKGLRRAVATLDMSASSRIITLRDFARYLEDHVGWPGVCQAREALKLASDRSMSPQETALRLVWLLDASLPAPLCNWPVADAQGTIIGRPDLICPELGVYGEFDGEGHRSREQQRDDVRRDEAFRATGLEGFRVVGQDLAQQELLIARMHAAVSRAAATGRPQTWQLQVSPPPVCRL